MVSFKRKPVIIPSPKFTPTDPNAPVYVIEQTLEYFVHYDDYLARLDFYNQKKFICELTGHSCLSYFDALEKEAKEARSVVVDFPEPTKEPILRCVQFSTTSRLDQLVDEVYNAIRSEFFVGEMLHARTRDQQRVRAKVLRKVQADKDYKYVCEYENNPGSKETYLGSELFRDRKNFNKMSVRTFIKFAANRENWAGCPWLVKKEYLERYPNIPTEWPESLRDLYNAREREETPATPEPQRRRKPVKVEKDVVDASDDLELMAVSPPPNPWPKWHEEPLLKGRTLGKALSVWYFLTAYSELLVLSPINFDAFLYAVSTNNVPVLAELFCAMLTLFVDPDEDILAIPFPSQYEPKQPKTGDEGLLEDSDQEMADEEEPPAAKYLSLDEDWMVRIGKRKFKNGGWQSLVICTLHEALYMREWQDTIQSLIDKLVIGEPSFENAAKAWNCLSPDEIVAVLDIFAQVLHTGPSVRQFMEVKADESTKIRKSRAEIAKEQKIITENLRVLRVKLHGCPEKDRDAIEKELEAANAKQRDLSEKTIEMGNQVLQNDCQRLRYLGKDRFFNRYWFMETNGVERPNLNEPNSNYLMARLWVQGPLREDLARFDAKYDAKLNAFKVHHFNRIHEQKVAEVQREREAHKLQRAKRQKREVQVHRSNPVSQPARLLPVQPAPQPAQPATQAPQVQGVQASQAPSHMMQPMRPMQVMQGMPMYYPQPMYMPQMHHYMQQGQYMPQGQQIMYMMPSTVNGVQTLVPVQMQGIPMPMQGMPMQGMPMHGMPMPYHPMHMQMQQMPMQPMQMQQIQMQPHPMQHSPSPMMDQTPNPVVHMAPMQQQVKEEHEPQAGGPSEVTEPEAQSTASAEPKLNDAGPDATPATSGHTTAQEDVSMAEPEDETSEVEIKPDTEPQPEAVGVPTQGVPTQGETVLKNENGAEGDASATVLVKQETEASLEEPVKEELSSEHPQNTKNPENSVADEASIVPAAVEAPAQAAPTPPEKELSVPASIPQAVPVSALIDTEENSERTVSPEAQKEANSSDTEDDLPAMPKRPSVEEITANGLKLSVEGEFSMKNENDWRYYETENELNALLLYLNKSGPREGRLYDKLVKLDPYIRHGMRNRLTSKSLNWSNTLAEEKLGHYHS